MPNPIGFLYLKQKSYEFDPIGRIKDLGDIIELCVGMVDRGSHYDLDAVYAEISEAPETQEVLSMVASLSSGESPRWDLEDARQELLKRGYTSDQLDAQITRWLEEWRDALVP